MSGNSKCCNSEVILAMTQEEMEEANIAPSMWRACIYDICKKCGKVCEII